MSNPVVLGALLLLILLVLAGNTMIALAFLRARTDKLKGIRGRNDRALDELHERVQDLNKRGR